MKLCKALTLLVLSLGLNAFAQKTFIITNDDPFRRPNSASTYSIQNDGSLLLLGHFPTGGNGGGNSGDPSGDGIGFIPATRIVVTPDNKFAFVTNAPDNTVSGFSIAPDTGQMTLIPGSPFPTGGNACQGMSLAASPDSHLLFALNTCSQDITSFQIGSNGSLTIAGPRTSTGSEGDDIKVTGDGKFLAASLVNFRLGAAMFKIGTDGTLAPVPGSPFPSTAFAGSLETNCAGDKLFVLNDGAPSAVDVFKIAADGSLSPAPQSPLIIPVPPNGFGESGMYLSPDQKLLFVADNASLVSSFHVADDGSLTPESSFVPGGTATLGHIVTDPSGKFLYGSSFISTMVSYSIDANGALSLLPQSPLTVPGLFALGSFAAYPSRSCSLTVSILLEPNEGNDDKEAIKIDADSGKKLEVAILSSATFDASTQIDQTSLTFGRTGSEPSLVSCRRQPRDVNGDNLTDLVCRFAVGETAFVPGDTQAILRGKTVTGTPIIGTAPVRVVP